MKFYRTEISDVIIFEPEVHSDNRGYFFESFNQKQFEKAVGRTVNFIQDNHSFSYKNVLRGLHYQLNPLAQAKLVRCLRGAIYDVAVDIRIKSPTFGKWIGVELSAYNKRQIWIPEGFAHGFVSLEDKSEIHYKTNNYYSKELERSIIWNDSDLNIEWPLKPDVISEKDSQAKKLKVADLFE
ncbi:dTDP-4-dehydrorhamnose 3,5-epimerase [Escherichia coli]|uniref:dTDP-4-dehydrorhamnose 3,5-epimerase n=1 Tax=Escherichia coli TaxID=562 RepID=UPI000FA58A29|nr:dTDP-4-dehydrorhamnose 3,5-epimerase [Escherichia coli]EEV7649630.1 dTDP-4-dehydrorhamnose 3,5-epimerase [Escherichia coli]EEW1871407.1 dTDP-4-dehydrorhamnose 3,5-epimerase [Escherichia coli]EFH3755572.1 dTDP-4-dehydrorhamnose 3,5-epimerase [Escherichia coli]EFM0297491.1 dTDP-4-dehydrorhamnose 3,5-epimerase [Escherichia coli]EFM0469121.1 dTDP-4-dehydrorhamnose 3,5-epimerase [Escherichia coli]